MFNFRKIYMPFLCIDLALALFACSGQTPKQEKTEEDLTAKKNLQGIWLDDDDDDVAFRVKGDTVFFPDSTSAPTYFRIERDSFVLFGGNTVKYHIVKQTPHLFVFVNQNGEKVKLKKTNDMSYLDLFAPKTVLHINQNKLVKRDSIMYYGDERYHCYVQINPTTYKVAKASYNDDGVEVDNMYYDNIINLCIYKGATSLFSSDLRKEMFKDVVPESFVKQAVFSDLTFVNADKEGLHFFAILAIPESSINYMVEVVVGYNGKLSKRIKK